MNAEKCYYMHTWSAKDDSYQAFSPAVKNGARLCSDWPQWSTNNSGFLLYKQFVSELHMPEENFNQICLLIFRGA